MHPFNFKHRRSGRGSALGYSPMSPNKGSVRSKGGIWLVVRLELTNGSVSYFGKALTAQCETDDRAEQGAGRVQQLAADGIGAGQPRRDGAP